jgi:hypothetical protein
MKVKIGDTWYSPTEVPIMLEMTEEDKERISSMESGSLKYALYPDNVFEGEEAVLAWMEADKILKEGKTLNE